MTDPRCSWLPPAWGHLALQRGLRLLFQTSCLHCAAPEGDPLCPDCLAQAMRLPGRHCVRCLGSLDRKGGCALCMRGDVPFEAVRALGSYSGGLKRAIRALKYRGRADIGLFLGQELAMRLSSWRGAPWLVVPVPVHARRRGERGYNQAELVAWRIARAHGWSYAPGAVERPGHSSPFYQQGRLERWSEAQVAFRAHAGCLRGRSVIVVDDILTSGATLWAMARAAREAGALRVRAAVLARAAMRAA